MEPRVGKKPKDKVLSDLHAVHVDAEVDLELSSHLDNSGHAVQQHVVELGRKGEWAWLEPSTSLLRAEGFPGI